MQKRSIITGGVVGGLFVVAVVVGAGLAAKNSMDCSGSRAEVFWDQFLRTGVTGRETYAISNLQAIATAEVTYSFDQTADYGDKEDLIKKGLLDLRFRSPINCYRYSVKGAGKAYTATATPVRVGTFSRYEYYVTEEGVVRYSITPSFAPAGMVDQPVQ
jgi:hypothetical protein